MELTITGKIEEPLLGRTKVEAEISFDKITPSETEIRKGLAKELGKDERLIVVKGIYTRYGMRKAKNVSYAYENEQILGRVEAMPKEKEGAAAAKAEEKKEEGKEAPEAKAQDKEAPKDAKKAETMDQKAAELKKQ